jgi:hypothetical protein
MTKNEIVQKNISLSFDFIRHLVQNPHLMESIPDGAEVEFVEHDLPVPVEPEREHKPCKAVLFKVEHTFREMTELRCNDESFGK